MTLLMVEYMITLTVGGRILNVYVLEACLPSLMFLVLVIINQGETGTQPKTSEQLILQES